MNQMLFYRFGVAFVAFAACCLFLVYLLIRFENGFYAPTEVPLAPLDAAHRRARDSFYKAMSLVLVTISVIGIGVFEWSTKSTWTDVGMPLVLGGYCSVLYAWITRSDRVRPRIT
jgi:hypothetical protein